ncbi:winged helix-turn-helix domain-containing protein [Halorarius litoreus]|uniref:winged helix-turn-helix domain-containing protein n=1 Tax=Halorarius litoreus TaxID=2962676 RepID=UPI0020CD4933|nr:helix-turn-helix domain-containing protein [Halorarius litoreus]
MRLRDSEPEPDLETVLDALDDETCRGIVEELTEPMTATEVSEACSVPLSTTYRKLDRLAEASLVTTATEVRRDGHHTTHYRTDFQSVLVEFHEESQLGVNVARPQVPEARLETLWSEVRNEV